MTSLPLLTATRYVHPLREGGSLPAVVDTSEAGLFVLKFRGAGQGRKALVAEVIAGLLASALDLPIPELALIELLPEFGQNEPDPEIQDILRQSRGVNVGLRYLEGAFNFCSAAAGDLIDRDFASRLVWFDAFITNPDRTARNANLLVWRERPWLIDHGAALYIHHNWSAANEERVRTPFPLIRDHILLGQANHLEEVDRTSATTLSEARLRDLLALVPDELLVEASAREESASAAEERERYLDYLLTRLSGERAFVLEATQAHERILREPFRTLGARR